MTPIEAWTALGYVLIWCADCEEARITPAPPDVWTWLDQHRRYGLCRMTQRREAARAYLGGLQWVPPTAPRVVKPHA